MPNCPRATSDRKLSNEEFCHRVYFLRHNLPELPEEVVYVALVRVQQHREQHEQQNNMEHQTQEIKDDDQFLDLPDLVPLSDEDEEEEYLIYIIVHTHTQ